MARTAPLNHTREILPFSFVTKYGFNGSQSMCFHNIVGKHKAFEGTCLRNAMEGAFIDFHQMIICRDVGTLYDFAPF